MKWGRKLQAVGPSYSNKLSDQEGLASVAGRWGLAFQRHFVDRPSLSSFHCLSHFRKQRRHNQDVVKQLFKQTADREDKTTNQSPYLPRQPLYGEEVQPHGSVEKSGIRGWP